MEAGGIIEAQDIGRGVNAQKVTCEVIEGDVTAKEVECRM